MKALLLLLLADEATAFSLRARPVVSWMRPSGRAALVAVETETASNVLESLQTFQSSHAFLYGLIVTLATRYAIGEVRRIVEKPVMDELGNRVTESLTPETEAIPTSAWPKLALCVGMDLAGDASELIPVLGEFTDVAFAPVEAGLLKVLFQSNLIAGFGFVEEILPFTDVVPTFTLAWRLSNLWPTTPLARKLLPDPAK